MKKTLLILTTILAFGLTSCSPDDTEEVQEEIITVYAWSYMQSTYQNFQLTNTEKRYEMFVDESSKVVYVRVLGSSGYDLNQDLEKKDVGEYIEPSNYEQVFDRWMKKSYFEENYLNN
jgi:hypothetical protein